MSRKPHTDSKVTRKKLISSATKEFSRRDYDHASLRLICGTAGVTTGAMYFFFENKEELFRTVLDPLFSDVLAEMDNIVITTPEERESNPSLSAETDEEIARNIIKIYLSHKAQTQIFLKNFDHPVVQEFVDRVTASVARNILTYIGASEDDPRMVAFAQWLADVRVQSIKGILEKGLPIDEAEDQICDVTRLFRGGLPAMVQQ